MTDARERSRGCSQGEGAEENGRAPSQPAKVQMGMGRRSDAGGMSEMRKGEVHVAPYSAGADETYQAADDLRVDGRRAGRAWNRIVDKPWVGERREGCSRSSRSC